MQIHSPSLARFLTVDVADQDQVFHQAFDILRQGIEKHSFPAASLAINHSGRLVAAKALGRFTYEESSPTVGADTLFDIASLTKVLATTSMAMALYQRGMLDLEGPLVEVLPEFAGEDARRDAVSFRMLLAHSSGLPAYEKLFLRATNRQALLEQALAMPLKTDPGTYAEYSDIGFILLGLALEKIAEEPIDEFCQREIFGPLGMANTAFNLPVASRSSVPPTADDRRFRKRIIQGEVQDENASVMGGIAAHAGLFANAMDITVFAQAMLHGGGPTLRPEAVGRFLQRESSPRDTSRALGWDTPSSPSQSGRYFSPRSFGHLGYTGTSLWIDPDRQLAVTLLTNRTWPDCANQSIKAIRPRFHDAVVEALGLGQP